MESHRWLSTRCTHLSSFMQTETEGREVGQLAASSQTKMRLKIAMQCFFWVDFILYCTESTTSVSERRTFSRRSRVDVNITDWEEKLYFDAKWRWKRGKSNSEQCRITRVLSSSAKTRKHTAARTNAESVFMLWWKLWKFVPIVQCHC